MTADVLIAAKSFLKLYANEESKARPFGVVPEGDRDTILQNLQFVEQLFPASCLMLCPRSHPGFHYFSRNCENVLGHKHQHLVKFEVTDVFSRIHPEDLNYVRQCFDFISGCEPLDPATHRFVLHFRFQSADGQYRHLRNEHIAIKTNATNNYLFLMLFNNISVDEKFHQVRLDVFRNMSGNFVKVYDYNPRQGRSEMTPRQHDIAKLISKGFSNQEIADQLSVSIFTVKNHKRLLFKKVQVKNSMQLVSARKLML